MKSKYNCIVYSICIALIFLQNSQCFHVYWIYKILLIYIFKIYAKVKMVLRILKICKPMKMPKLLVKARVARTQKAPRKVIRQVIIYMFKRFKFLSLAY